MCGTTVEEMTADKATLRLRRSLRTVISNRDKVRDESEDKTIRADAVHEQGNTCLISRATAEESRRQRMRGDNVVISRKQARRAHRLRASTNQSPAAVEARASGFKRSNPQGWSQTSAVTL